MDKRKKARATPSGDLEYTRLAKAYNDERLKLDLLRPGTEEMDRHLVRAKAAWAALREYEKEHQP